MGKKGSIGEAEHPDLWELIDRIGHLFSMLRISGVHGDVPDALLPLHPDDVYRPDITLRLADSCKNLTQAPRPLRVLDPKGHAVANARGRFHGNEASSLGLFPYRLIGATTTLSLTWLGLSRSASSQSSRWQNQVRGESADL